MPAPTNTTITTAQDLGATVPVTITETADNAGTTYDLWFQRTVLAGEVEWSLLAFGDLAVYKPTVTFWTGPTGAPVLIQTGGINKAIQVCVTPYVGDVLYMKVATNAGNPTPAELTLNLQVLVGQTVPVGAVAVNDDRDTFPAVFYNSATGAPYFYASSFPASDFADVLPTGQILALNLNTDTWTLFASDLSILAHPNPGSGFTRVSSNQVDTFYVANNTTHVVKTISSTGVVGGTSWTVTAGPQSIAPAIDDSILYYVETNATNQPIKRWDLVNDIALADLVAGIANYLMPKTLVVLTDGTIIAPYIRLGVDSQVKHYSAAGATLHTFAVTDRLNQVSHAINDPLSFWYWKFTDNAAEDMVFREILISTGATVQGFTVPQYTAGIYAGTATATPLRFGNSDSCQFWIQRAQTNVQTTTFTIRRQRRGLLPSSPSQYRMSIPTLEQLMRTGIGLLPDATGSSTPYGAEPTVRLRISKDGGKTWGPERSASAGTRGHYKDRVRWLQATGNYRNGVFEITVDHPVDFQMLALLGEPVEGSS